MYEVDFAIMSLMPKHKNHKRNKHKVYIPSVSEDQTGEIQDSPEEPAEESESGYEIPAEAQAAAEASIEEEPVDEAVVEPVTEPEEPIITEKIEEPEPVVTEEPEEPESDVAEPESAEDGSAETEEQPAAEEAEPAAAEPESAEDKPAETGEQPAAEETEPVAAEPESAENKPAAEETEPVAAEETAHEAAEPKPAPEEDPDDLDPEIDAVDTVPIREIFIRRDTGKKKPVKERKPKEPKQPKERKPEAPKVPDEKEAKKEKAAKLPRIRENLADGTQSVKKTGKKKPKGYNILFVPEDGRRVKSIRTSAEAILAATFVLAGILAAIVVYLVWNSFSAEEYKEEITALQEEIVTLSEDKIVLEADIERLEQQLSDATTEISAKETQAQADTEIQALQAIPSALPINSGALPSDYDKEKHWITIDAAAGTHVVATGDGTVTYAGESAEAGGFRVTVEHGNGYETNYYCQSFPVVTQGAAVSRGTTLFAIVDTDKLIYQIKYEDDFIDPYTVLNIAG